MSTTAWVVIGLAVLVILVILLVSRGSGRRRQPDLMALSAESHDRYLAEWDRIEARFVEAPAEAVREADSLVMSMLRERRHPLEARSLPREVREARRDASARRGDSTERMRLAMLHYRAVMEKMVGTPVRDEPESEVRREMA